MLTLKIVAIFLLLWFVAGAIGLMYRSLARPRFVMGLALLSTGAVTYYLWLA